MAAFNPFAQAPSGGAAAAALSVPELAARDVSACHSSHMRISAFLDPLGDLSRSVTYRKYMPTTDTSQKRLSFTVSTTKVPLVTAWDLGWRGGDGVALQQWQPSLIGASGPIVHDLTDPDSIRRTAEAILARAREEAARVEPSLEITRGFTHDMKAIGDALQKVWADWLCDDDDIAATLNKSVEPLNRLVSDTTRVIPEPVVLPDLAEGASQAAVIETCAACIAPLAAGTSRLTADTTSANRYIFVDASTWRVATMETIARRSIDMDGKLAARAPLRLPKAQAASAELNVVPGTSWTSIDNNADYVELRIQKLSALPTVILRLQHMPAIFSELVTSPTVLAKACATYGALRALGATVNDLLAACAPILSRAYELVGAANLLNARLASLGVIGPVRRPISEVNVSAWCGSWPRASNGEVVAVREGTPFPAAHAALLSTHALRASLANLRRARTSAVTAVEAAFPAPTPAARTEPATARLMGGVHFHGYDTYGDYSSAESSTLEADLRGRTGDAILKVIQAWVQRGRTVRKLDLQHSTVDEATLRGLEAFSRSLSGIDAFILGSITKQVPLTAAACGAVSRFLTITPKLKELNLAQTDLNAERLEVIAAAFPRLPELTTLNLMNNPLGSDGVAVLLSHMRAIRRLAHLNVWCCRLTLADVAAIQAAAPAGCVVVA